MNATKAEEGDHALTVATRAEQLATKREARFQARKAALEADPTIDPRRRDWYLDRTLWNTEECATALGITPQRISTLRGGRRTAKGRILPVKTWPHPSVFPDPDRVDPVPSFGSSGGSPLVEAGRLRHWAVQRYHTLDLNTGKLIKGRQRMGRGRHNRTMMSKVQSPGAPRKARKTQPAATPEDDDN